MNTSKKGMSTRTLVLGAVLTALVAILAYMGGFVKIGGLASISLTLIPIVIGAALCGTYMGAWLGGVAGAVFFSTADAAFWFGLSIPGTVITVMVLKFLQHLSVIHSTLLLVLRLVQTLQLVLFQLLRVF